MPLQQASPVSVENNFTKGLITEFTGLNFPENAATDTNNCLYSLVGDVTRRLGFNYEDNFALNVINRTGAGINTYKWNNVGGDGLTQLIVQQTGGTLYFYSSSAATITHPLSTQKLVSTVTLSTFVATGNVLDTSIECQFADGNGYLFVYHPQCDTFYCSYTAGVITAKSISLQIRDFTGIFETSPANTRPTTLNNEHLYNLSNQGWTNNAATWSATSTSAIIPHSGIVSFGVSSGMAVGIGDVVTIYIPVDTTPGGVFVAAGTTIMTGVVSSYIGTTLTINVNFVYPPWNTGSTAASWVLFPTNIHGNLNAWFATTGNYPSNADVWWYFKDSNGTFNPAATLTSTTLASGNAPQGSFLLNPFRQTRSAVSGITGLTDVTTTARPKTGCWFQGRVWYTGVDASFAATGDAIYTTWTENLYFSQIVQTQADFGTCYQTNDPTSENLFDLLPTDGGIINIQGSGSIYKLFPIQNGMLVFAANGIWFITGSQGIGFSANDYTITKISSVQSISSTSFVDVQGLPYFWNEEGIYSVQPGQNGGLMVEPLTVGTILTFYNNIPKQSKKYVRGAYHPIDYILQWIYKSENEVSVTDRYSFDSVLSFNTYNKAFYPYSLPASGYPLVNGINYVSGPGGSTSPDPIFKYLTSDLQAGVYNFTFSEENDDVNYVDFISSDGVGSNYTSYFVTGFKLHGQGQRRFQMPYLYMYSRNDAPNQYKIQSIWDYGSTRNSGRWSTAQLILNNNSNFGVIFRRHRLRGQGLVLQIKITSVDGQPFDIVGWSAFETQNTGI